MSQLRRYGRGAQMQAPHTRVCIRVIAELKGQKRKLLLTEDETVNVKPSFSFF